MACLYRPLFRLVEGRAGERLRSSGKAPLSMVRSRRLELPRDLSHSDLNAARLPVPPRPHGSRRAGSSPCLTRGGNGIPNLGGPDKRHERLGFSMDWQIARGLVDYEEAVAAMADRAARIRAGAAEELVWLLEHPPLYTAGTSADPAD